MGPTDNGVRTKAKRRSENIMDDDIVEEGRVCRRRERLVHYYGTIKGEEVGKTYRSRDKLKIIHYPDKSWIHLGPEGPYSIIVQGKNRFLDEGPLVIVFTKAPVGSSSGESERTASNTIIGNLRKAVKGRLPIRVIRLVKSDRDKKTVFRYDGLYIMKKKLILHEKLHFLLTRIRKQPKVKFNIKRGSCKIRRLLALKKKTKQIKKEPVLKKEVISNSDTERDSTQAVEEIFNGDQLKEEIATLSEEDTPDCDDGFEDWQRSEFPSFVKADSSEQLEQSAYVNYDEHFRKMETSYYEELDNTIEDFNNEEDQDHFTKEDVIIESIPLLKSENGESSDDVRTIIAIVPESTTEYVEETIDADFDPIYDPLGSFSDESKTSNCCDEIKITSQEVKSCYDEKKSRELYFAECERIEDSVKDQFLPIMPHTCLYSLTVGHLINLLGNRSNNNVCPCSTQKCAAQRNFEAALKCLIAEGGKKSCSPKCLKGIEEDDDIKKLESTEISYFSFNNVFDQFNTILFNKTSINDTQAPLIGKRQHIRTTKILRKGKTPAKRYSKKVVRVEKSLVSSTINESLVPSGDDEEHLLHSNVEDSSLPPVVEDSIMTSDVSQPTDPSYGITSPMPENNTIRLPSADHQCTEKLLNPNNQHNRARKGKQRWTKNFSREAAQLGPVIPTEEPKPIPSRLKHKKINYRGASFYISPRNISSRSASHRRKASQEEEVDFFGFEEPIRPSKKLRSIRSFLNKLISLEQSSLSK